MSEVTIVEMVEPAVIDEIAGDELNEEESEEMRQIIEDIPQAIEFIPDEGGADMEGQGEGGEEGTAEEIMPYFCNQCQKLFPTQSHMDAHTCGKQAHIKPHMCPVCNCKFDPRLNSHPNRKIYVCGICKKSFVTGPDLKTHFFKHIQENLSTCHVCNKMFDRPVALRKHYRTEHKDIVVLKEKPFVCPECGKTFGTKCNMQTHLRVHSEDRPFCCSICQRGFKSNWELKSHFLIHTNEKPFLCKICGKTFRQSGNLSSHMRIHNNEKPYVCKVCNKGFGESGKLRRHFRIHTEEKPYTCSMCGKLFRDGSNMKAHMKIHKRGAHEERKRLYKRKIVGNVVDNIIQVEGLEEGTQVALLEGTDGGPPIVYKIDVEKGMIVTSTSS